MNSPDTSIHVSVDSILSNVKLDQRYHGIELQSNHSQFCGVNLWVHSSCVRAKLHLRTVDSVSLMIRYGRLRTGLPHSISMTVLLVVMRARCHHSNICHSDLRFYQVARKNIYPLQASLTHILLLHELDKVSGRRYHMQVFFYRGIFLAMMVTLLCAN